MGAQRRALTRPVLILALCLIVAGCTVSTLRVSVPEAAFGTPTALVERAVSENLGVPTYAPYMTSGQRYLAVRLPGWAFSPSILSPLTSTPITNSLSDAYGLATNVNMLVLPGDGSEMSSISLTNLKRGIAVASGEVSSEPDLVKLTSPLEGVSFDPVFLYPGNTASWEWSLFDRTFVPVSVSTTDGPDTRPFSLQMGRVSGSLTRVELMRPGIDLGDLSKNRNAVFGLGGAGRGKYAVVVGLVIAQNLEVTIVDSVDFALSMNLFGSAVLRHARGQSVERETTTDGLVIIGFICQIL